MRRTPLYEAYRDSPGVRMTEFGGWQMPLCFESGIIAEHLAVREGAGLFDVSHMGELWFEGAGSLELLDWLVTNDVRGMEVCQALYSPMCAEDGGTIDDLVVYRLDREKFLVVVNAARTAIDFAWMSRENPWIGSSGSPPRVSDRSEAIALLALQGPSAAGLLQPLVDVNLAALGRFRFAAGATVVGKRALVSRTGYTGEDGFELFVDRADARAVWEGLLRSEAGATPCGLGARDTLRIEARLPLYGQELSEEISPLEAGLKAFVKLDKPDFCGKQALARERERGSRRALRGFQMVDRGVARHGHRVSRAGRVIGEVTSGTKSPSLGAFIGLALLEAGSAGIGDEVTVSTAPEKRARIVPTPFYRRIGGER